MKRGKNCEKNSQTTIFHFGLFMWCALLGHTYNVRVSAKLWKSQVFAFAERKRDTIRFLFMCVTNNWLPSCHPTQNVFNTLLLLKLPFFSSSSSFFPTTITTWQFIDYFFAILFFDLFYMCATILHGDRIKWFLLEAHDSFTNRTANLSSFLLCLCLDPL